MGRKNFLFHNTANGAEASAIVYSLVESAKANNINVFEYLQTVLLYMPDYKNEPAGIEDMLPWSDFVYSARLDQLSRPIRSPETLKLIS